MTYRVQISAEFYAERGDEAFPGSGLLSLDRPGIDVSIMDQSVAEFAPHHLEGAHSLIMMGGTRVTERSLDGVTTLRHIARFGSGFDSVDIDACSSRGVLVTNTPDAVRRPMALATLTMLLATAHNLVQKDALTRRHRWLYRSRLQGNGVETATVGIVGFGGIGQETAKLVSPLASRVLVSNRSDKSASAEALGAQQVTLDKLLAESDYVILTVPYNPDTHHLVGVRELSRMKSSGVLINMARGNVVDEEALINALESGTIGGAGLDVYADEPVRGDNRLLKMENVTLSPHSLCWTDAFAAAVGSSIVDAVFASKEGRRPHSAVNPQVLSH